MRAREYSIVIEGEAGAAPRELTRAAGTGHPLVGDEVVIEGVLHAVTRVRHADDPDAGGADASYTFATVFVRRLGARPWRRQEAEEAGATVLPLALPPPDGDGPLTSAILPATLVAVLVAAGYREQATRYRGARRASARLTRDGHGWLLATTSAAELRLMSRRAKRCFVELTAAMGARRFSATCAASSSPTPSTPATTPAAPPTPRAPRPTLRLV